jgi:hypothetical protein
MTKLILTNSLSIKLSGTWDDHLNALWLEDTEDYPKGHKLQLWKMFNDNYAENAYKFTRYSMTFNCILFFISYVCFDKLIFARYV